MWTIMSHLWKCVLLSCMWCLLIFSEIVTARLDCLRSGECFPGFYCHTGSGLCVSCDKCSYARGNLHLCEKECSVTTIPTSPTPDVPIEDRIASNKPMIVAVIVVPVVILAAVIVAWICWYRRCRAKEGTAVLETGDESSRMGPTTTLPLPDCASPDESMNHNHLSLLLPAVQQC